MTPDVDTEREGLRERKKRLTRHALRMAALTLVAERGLDAVTAEDVAAAADVSPRTFFNYFASKEEALVGNDPALVAFLREDLVARPPDEEPLEALRAVFLDYADGFRFDREMWSLRLLVIDRNPSLLPALMGATAELERVLAEAVAERVGSPPADPYPALVVAAATAAVRTATRHWGAVDAGPGLVEVITDVFDALARGLTPP
ncbi:TetR family transcriptional regulator [Actinotalea sp. Marseille-Q4924]|uniref:acyl-CoA-like ligand-binding transcription factor n=1 Tax=Actinotalea sp. Marseille-Q4924 TaxID=2866571 RepID=UPI001CE3BFE5|nr:TetR family transcriptional regulator [Actinotalea sp. Marseille-Q4924]